MLDWLTRFQKPLFAAAAVMLGLVFVGRALLSSSPPGIEFRTDPLPASGKPIRVQVAGAVVSPGVYELRDGDRVADALAAAGGPTEGTGVDDLNLARRVRDEERISVSGRSGAVSSGVQVMPGGLININTASEATLDTLPGIGEAYARRIIDSRRVDGAFRQPEELLTRRLLPRSTYEGILSLITVGP